EGEEDPRIAGFRTGVERPLLDLLRSEASDEEIREVSTFVLYDFAGLLHDRMRPVWDLLQERMDVPGGGFSPPLGAVERFVQELLTEPIDAAGTTWARAMTEVWQERELLLAGDPGAPSYA